MIYNCKVHVSPFMINNRKVSPFTINKSNNYVHLAIIKHENFHSDSKNKY